MVALSDLPDETWAEVLDSIDRTYQELIDHQNQLEARNAELEGMRAFLNSVLAAMTDVLVVCGAEGQVLEVNRAFLSLTGARKEDLVGTSAAALFTGADREALTRDLAALKVGNRVEIAERALLTPEGSAPLELVVTARTDRRRRVVGSVLIGRPVGELRKAYLELEASHAALKAAQVQLIHSEKLASLGRLVAGVAHELNNPISFVYGNAHALERYAGRLETYFERVQAGAPREELAALRETLKLDRAVAQMRTAVSGALEGAERVRDIVESLRRLSAEGSGEAEPFDLSECARTATHWVVKGRGSNVPVTLEAEGPIMVEGRVGHVQQVIMNLVTNALDAVEGATAPLITVRVAEHEGCSVLEVADNGPGIPDDIAIRLFDPFFTTKPVGKGTGLGLSISYKIVEEHGGRLAAENRPGGGALFRLELPVRGGPGCPPETARGSAERRREACAGLAAALLPHERGDP